MDWESLYQQYRSARENHDGALIESLARVVRTALSNRNLQDVTWLETALLDNERKWFVAWAVCRNKQMPERLFTPMIHAAVSQPDPSSPRQFVEPCLRCFSPRRVNIALLNILESGTDSQKIGAASTLYFAMGMVGRDGIADEEINDLRERRRDAILHIFVENENLQLRRCLLAQLSCDESFYPEHLRSLLSEAIRIAQDNPDEYLRHRIKIQLGANIPYMPLPDHEAIKEPATNDLNP